MKKITAIISLCLLLSSCTIQLPESQTVSTAEAATEETSLTDAAVTEPASYQPTDSDKSIAEWFTEYIYDSEEFTDKIHYQYYARALGLDKDYFLNPELWEVYYNKDLININREVDNNDIYLIRLNPYKLLDIYAANNNTTVKELCSSLSVGKEQLYYNWGYNPASVDYMDNHTDNKVTYSEAEKKIFGIYNNESRDIVMSTHMLTVNHEDETISYSSTLTDNMNIYRRDNLNAFTENGQLYSDYSEAEKASSFKVNGIGIRCVIPFSMPNAFSHASDSGAGDENVSVMVNVSPYAYGCTDSDKIDIASITSASTEQ